MDFDLTEDHLLLRNSLERLLQAECTPEALRASDHRPNEARWAALGEIGLMGLLLPEDRGGLAADEVALAVIGEACGRHALPEPVLDTVAFIAPLLDTLAEAGSYESGELLEDVLAGTGHWLPLPDNGFTPVGAPPPDGIIVERAGGWHAIEANETELVPGPSLDPLRLPYWIAGAVDGRYLGVLKAERSRLLTRRGVLAVSGELLGLGHGLLDKAVDYAGTRKQFGQPIGSFQAVQHALADVWVALRFAQPVLYRAAWATSVDDPLADMHTAHAKIACWDAADLAARTSMQVFGAMGYTYESDLHFWLKRVWALKDAWGTRDHHEAVIADNLAHHEDYGVEPAFPHRPLPTPAPTQAAQATDY